MTTKPYEVLAKVDAQGRVALPAAVRDVAGIKPGYYVRLEISEIIPKKANTSNHEDPNKAVVVA